MKRLLWAIGLLCFGLSGCLHSGNRLKSPEEIEKDRDLAVHTVGDVTVLANAGVWQVSGVGLVTGLDGTGDAPKGEFRAELEKQLMVRQVENVKKILDDPSNALVLITARIPLGCMKGDPLDIEVSLPKGSKCTSLKGGYLQEAVLWNHENIRRLKPDADSDRVLKGHVFARAKGPLVVGLGGPGEPMELMRGRIFEGGVSLVERPFFFELRTDEKSAKARVAGDVASRINFMFREDPKKRDAVLRNKHLFLLEDVTQKVGRGNESLGRDEMAKAVSPTVIQARLPYVYRHDPERYLRVARLTPLREDAERSGPYRRRLQKMLLDPKDTIHAALRLEALGSESVTTLKQGLSSEYPLVRLASAEALLYLGSLAGVDELAKLAEEHPLFRTNCLAALASSDESVCKQKLAHMLGSTDTELRCGAFWALRLNRDTKEENPAFRSPYLRTDRIADICWLHRPAPESTPLVQVFLQGRPEIALFGQDVALQAPVRVTAGPEFVIALEKGDTLCTVSRFVPGTGARRQQCGILLEDVMRAMVELGAEYPELIDLVRSLDSGGALPCPVAVNIVPERVEPDVLTHEGKDLVKGR